MLTQATASQVLHLLTDAHGSVRAVLDASAGATTAAILQDYAYSAYGVDLNLPASPLTAIRYAGQMIDPVTGLSFNRARWYDPAAGRFASFDYGYAGSSFQPMTLQRYAYAAANPIMLIDPSGHDFSLTGMLVTAGINSILGGIVSPIIQPATSFLERTVAGTILDPNVIKTMINAVNSVPPELMLGVDLMFGAGVGPLSVTTGYSVEALLGNVNQMYWARNEWSIALGQYESSPLRGMIAGKAGAVFGVSDANKYRGWFSSITVPVGSLPKALFNKLSQWTNTGFAGVLAAGISNLPTLGTAADRWVEPLKDAFLEVRSLSKDLGWLGQISQRLVGKTYVTVFWSGDGTDWGFDFSYGIGNAGSFSFTRSNYHYISEPLYI